MAKNYAKLHFESEPGSETVVPTAGSKVIFIPGTDVQVGLNPTHLERDDEIRGLDEPVAVIAESFEPNWSLTSRIYPDVLGFLLKAQLGAPTTTVGDGVITDSSGETIPTGAYRHVWTSPFGPSGPSPQTAGITAGYVDQGLYFNQRGAAVESINLATPPQGGATIEASGPATYMERVPNPSDTPSYESLTIRPFMHSHVSLPTWLATGRDYNEFSVSINNPVAPERSMSGESKFPDLMEKGDGVITVTGSVTLRNADDVNWDALKNATGFTAKAQWISESKVADDYPYKFFVSMSNAQYVGGEVDAMSNARRKGMSLNWKATNAGTAAVTIEVVNATSAY